MALCILDMQQTIMKYDVEEEQGTRGKVKQLSDDYLTTQRLPTVRRTFAQDYASLE